MIELTAPLLWLAVTFVVFEGADSLSRASNRHPFAHPVLLATPVLIAILYFSGTDYRSYYDATFPLSFLLGPAVVGLAVPIWEKRALIRRLALPIGIALSAGAVTAIISAVGIMLAFGAPQDILVTIAPRATTTPVAMAMATALGGAPSLAAAIVLFAGVVGGMTATPLFNLMKVTDYRARGFAAGVSAHGFGTARAFQVDPTAGAFASLGMALNAVFTATLLSMAGLVLG